MNDVLCIYYSRTGKTKAAMEEIAGALDAELVELRDGVERGGWKGWLRCGMDAMRRTTSPVRPFETSRPVKDYHLVIIGTPVWAGRCSSTVRDFLKRYGKTLQNAARTKMRRSMNRWTSMPPAATRPPSPCGAARWATPFGKRNFCARCGSF